MQHVGTGDLEQDLLIDGKIQLAIGSDDVVLGIEFIVGPRIAKVPIELPTRYFTSEGDRR